MTDMSRAELRAEHKAALCDSAGKFVDPDDLDRHLDTAARELARVNPMVKTGVLSLVADQSDYAVPDDLLAPMGSRYGFTGLRDYRPWETNYPKDLPRLAVERDENDARVLILTQPPTAAMISVHGAEYRYRYKIKHTIADDAADTTVPEDQRDLLLQRALIAALHALAAAGIAKPVSLGASGYSAPRNGHPAAIAEQLLKDWHHRILN